MRLEKVVLDGFKSFADKTEFPFGSSITGIVGPNGCGKSNVVDAVKWVFGEQSAKSLRSGRMADVIFSGSTTRKPAGAAEVTVTFSNADGSASGRLPIDAAEVQVSRKIFQTGESEYRVNGKMCRLKDVRELFMDTGIGVKAYSIIEQGQVERLLTSSAADRRIIFEEAAGISKYKAHKEEALRKLDHTEQNLLRLADILAEVASRLRSVKLAAGKARNYLQYTQRLKELQVNYSLAEFDKVFKGTCEKKAALEETEKQFAAASAELARHDAMQAELGQKIIDAENQINQTDNSLVAVQSRIEQHLQRIEFLRTRLTELEQRKAAAADRQRKLQQQHKAFEADLAKCHVEEQQNEESLAEKNRSSVEIETRIADINSQCASLEADLRDEKSGIIDIVRRTAQLHNEVQSISVYRDNLASQKDRLAGRAESAKTELEKLLTEKAQYEQRLIDIEKVLADLAASNDSKRKEGEQLIRQMDTDNRRLGGCKEARSALASEHAVLADMEKRLEGVKTGVKKILENRSQFNYVEAILADIVAADIEYAAAAEAALEGMTDTLLVADTARLLAGREEIERIDGRVNFVCADRIHPFVDDRDLSNLPGVKGRLVEFVNYDSRYAPLVWNLLGKTIVVDSIESAVQVSSVIGRDCQFVTLKGEFADGDGAIKVGPLGKATGLISRKSRLRQLQDAIARISEEIGGLERQIADAARDNEHLAKLCKDLRTAIYEATTEKMQVGSKISSLEDAIKRLREEQPLITGEIDLLEQQIAQSVQKEYESKQQLQELEAVNTQRSDHIKELEAAYTDRKRDQQQLLDKLTDLKVAIGQAAEHREAIKQTIISLEGQLRANAAAAEAAHSELHGCEEQMLLTQRDILAAEARVSELFVEKDQRQQSSSTLHREIEQLIGQRREVDETVRRNRQALAEVEHKINEIRIELGQLEVKQQDLVERVRDELQLDLVESYKQYQASAVDWDKVREEIADLRGKIERLGNVNLDAIAEQDGLEQRHQFLTTQLEDLNSSKGQLQQLINRLNKISREKFAETFELVRGHFQQIFRKLFGGGKADIILEQADDILDAGIEIIAKPPGKETRSISLLSGGEKAMTAIALLFSVFKAKPSPFCFLDEVDAPLDEANNERFNLLVKEFQKDSQFVVITHSKRTMSIAETLYGVTMQTRGVSKKIGVTFEHVEDETAAVA